MAHQVPLCAIQVITDQRAITTVVDVMSQPHNVYIGRALAQRFRGIILHNPYHGFWGNPFKIGVDGDRQQVVELYERWLLHDPAAHEHRRRLPELHGRILGCHCHPKPCHGDVLAKLADTTTCVCTLVPRLQRGKS
jgi:hypothetical protein